MQVLKDLDALSKMRSSDDRILKLRKSQMDTLTTAIKRDISFLAKLNLMDYSLLIGIEAPRSPATASFLFSGEQPGTSMGEGGGGGGEGGGREGLKGHDHMVLPSSSSSSSSPSAQHHDATASASASELEPEMLPNAANFLPR